MSTKIYLVENIEPGTNKVYIGKTKNNTRYYGHQSKYGLQIKYTIIDEINSLNRLVYMCSTQERNIKLLLTA